MSLRTITCADCGASREAIYKNTLYCLSCRLLRNLAAFDPEERTCRAENCSNAFLPVSRKDIFCGPHIVEMSALPHTHCKFCKRDDAPMHKGVAICARCVRDPLKRPSVIGGLKSGQRQRRAENGLGTASPQEGVNPKLAEKMAQLRNEAAA